jgi:hypothetical protein
MLVNDSGCDLDTDCYILSIICRSFDFDYAPRTYERLKSWQHDCLFLFFLSPFSSRVVVFRSLMSCVYPYGSA